MIPRSRSVLCWSYCYLVLASNLNNHLAGSFVPSHSRKVNDFHLESLTTTTTTCISLAVPQQGGNGYSLNGMGHSPSPPHPSPTNNTRAINHFPGRVPITTISKPEDLLEFVLEDERLSIVKVYAGWCRTCKAFDLKWRKLANQEGDKVDPHHPTSKNVIIHPGRVRFAEMDFQDNEELCRLLNATRLPFIIMYKGNQGKMVDFQCGPANFAQVIQNVNKYADPLEVASLVETNEPTRDTTTISDLTGPQTPHMAAAASAAKELWEKDVLIAKLNDALLDAQKTETENSLKKSWEQLRQKEASLQNMEKRLKQMMADHDEEMMRAREAMFAEKATEIKALETRLKGTVVQFRMQIEALEVEKRDLQAEFNSSIRANADKVEKLEGRIAVYEKERKSLRMLSVLALQRMKGAFAIRQHMNRMRSAGKSGKKSN